MLHQWVGYSEMNEPGYAMGTGLWLNRLLVGRDLQAGFLSEEGSPMKAMSVEHAAPINHIASLNPSNTTADGSDWSQFSKTQLLVAMFNYFESHPLGYVGFIVFLTCWTTLAFPVTPLEVCGGCVFGPIWGTLGSLVGKTAGCICALSIGRIFGKNWSMPSVLEQYLGVLKKKPFQVLASCLHAIVVSDMSHLEQTMCAIRVAPIPLGVKNYGLSLVRFPGDKYPFAAYFWSCFLVGLPFSIVWGTTGAGFSSVVDALAAS
eukprot:767620-Hanusia_phi.AAC.6